MEKKLYQAAAEGNVPSMLKLLSDDPFLLDRSIVGPCTESPLHIASMLGHLQFVNETLSRKPELASEMDSQGSSPLHLATAKGYLSIVKSLLVADPQMCFYRDKFGRNPIHVSAIKGRVDVMKEKIGVRPGAALLRISNGDTILYLCVINNRLESLKELVGRLDDRELVNSKNDDGNNILHLAAADQQNETKNFLINHTEMDTSPPNLKGLIALDILARANVEKAHATMDYALSRNGIKPILEKPPTVEHPFLQRGKHKNFKRQCDWPDRMRGSLMVVASLIATMAFQVGVNPPGGVWQGTSQEKVQAGADPPSEAQQYTFQGDGPWGMHYAGFSIMANTNPSSYSLILLFNTISFIASLSIILLLISGLPIRWKLFLRFLMLIMWIAITCIALSYVISTTALTPYGLTLIGLYVQTSGYNLELIGFYVTIFGPLAWCTLVVLLLVVHVIRLVIRMVKKIMKKRNKRLSSTNSTTGV